jgi:putative transposase
MILEGIAWRFRAGAPWRDLPVDFGPWKTVWKRHYRWSVDGTYARVFLAVQQAFGGRCELAEEVRSILSVDSTSVRAHQHAAGARNDLLVGSTLTRGGTELQDSAAGTR